MTSALRLSRQATEPSQPPTNKTDIFIDTDGDLAYKRADGSVGKLKGGGALNLAGYDLTLGADSTLAGSLTGGGAVTIATGQTAAFARGGVPMLRGTGPVSGRIPYMGSNTDELHASANLAYNAVTGVVTADKLTVNNVVTAPGMKPASDSTTALQLQNAAGTAVLTVDTTNSTVNALRFKVNVVSLANDAVQTVAGTFGMCLVQNNSAGGQLLLFLSGSSTNTISSIGTSLSTTKDTAGKVNVYIEGGALKIQNKSGGTLTLSYLTFTS